MTSSWQSGAAWATPYCYVLRCSKPAVSPNQSFRRTKTEGGFHIGLCTRTQGLNKSQNKGHVQSDQAAAYLLHGRSAYWRTAFLFAQKMDCQHFFRQIFLGYFSDIVQAFDTLRKNVCGDDYTSLHNPIVLSSVLPAYGMFHSIQILFL